MAAPLLLLKQRVKLHVLVYTKMIRAINKEAVCLHDSVIRGHHIYKTMWTPVLGEVNYLEIEEGNEHDHFAVCVKRGNEIVGHVPRELSATVWHFLRDATFGHW